MTTTAELRIPIRKNIEKYKLSTFYDNAQTKDKLEHEMIVIGVGIQDF